VIPKWLPWILGSQNSGIPGIPLYSTPFINQHPCGGPAELRFNLHPLLINTRGYPQHSTAAHGPSLPPPSRPKSPTKLLWDIAQSIHVKAILCPHLYALNALCVPSTKKLSADPVGLGKSWQINLASCLLHFLCLSCC